MRKDVWLGLAALALLLGSPLLARSNAQDLPDATSSTDAPRTYTYVDLGVLGDPGVCPAISAAWHANRAGQVVGASTTDVCGASHAFLWRRGRLRDLGVIGGGTFAASAAYGVNENGDIVGQTHVDGSQPPHAFLFQDGVMSDLGTGFGDGSFSRAWAVNDLGVVVGERGRQQSSPVRAVLWRNGRIRDLGTLGGTHGGPFGTNSVAHDVNDRGQVVGAALPPTGPLHAFLWEDGALRDLGTLGSDAEATQAWAINESMQVVGSSPTVAGPTHAVLWQEGAILDLGTLGGTSSYAYDINAQGHVVGGSQTPTSPDFNAGRAFIWRNGRMRDLNLQVTNLPPGVVLEIARAITDNGLIAGTTCSAFCEPGATAPTRGFLLVPNRP